MRCVEFCVFMSFTPAKKWSYSKVFSASWPKFTGTVVEDLTLEQELSRVWHCFLWKGEAFCGNHAQLALFLNFRSAPGLSGPSSCAIHSVAVAHLKNKHKRKGNKDFTQASRKFDSTTQPYLF